MAKKIVRSRFLIFFLLVVVLLGGITWIGTNRLQQIEKTLVVELPALDRHASWLLLEIERLDKAARLFTFDQSPAQTEQFTRKLDLAFVRAEHVLSIGKAISTPVKPVADIIALFKNFDALLANSAPVDQAVLKGLLSELEKQASEVKFFSVALNNETLYAINAQAEELRSFNIAMMAFVFAIAVAVLVICWLLLRQQRISENLALANRRAEAATLSKSYFLAAMSHELRTPLTAILGFSSMMENQIYGKLGSQKYDEYANIIHTSGTHLLQLVNDILDLSAVEAGKMALTKENLSIHNLIKDCRQIIEPAAAEKNISFSIAAPADLPALHADARALKQILLNLLSNAVKFTPDNGSVGLQISTTDKQQIFTVTDNGAGIPSEHLADLTDPFVKHGRDPHKFQEGSGLGLAIVQALVDLHQGELRITSDVGQGTTATVKLPREVSSEGAGNN